MVVELINEHSLWSLSCPSLSTRTYTAFTCMHICTYICTCMPLHMHTHPCAPMYTHTYAQFKAQKKDEQHDLWWAEFYSGSCHPLLRNLGRSSSHLPPGWTLFVLLLLETLFYCLLRAWQNPQILHVLASASVSSIICHNSTKMHPTGNHPELLAGLNFRHALSLSAFFVCPLTKLNGSTSFTILSATNTSLWTQSCSCSWPKGRWESGMNTALKAIDGSSPESGKDHAERQQDQWKHLTLKIRLFLCTYNLLTYSGSLFSDSFLFYSSCVVSNTSGAVLVAGGGALLVSCLIWRLLTPRALTLGGTFSPKGLACPPVSFKKHTPEGKLLVKGPSLYPSPFLFHPSRKGPDGNNQRTLKWRRKLEQGWEMGRVHLHVHLGRRWDCSEGSCWLPTQTLSSSESDAVWKDQNSTLPAAPNQEEELHVRVASVKDGERLHCQWNQWRLLVTS